MRTRRARWILLIIFLTWGIFRLGYSIAAYNPIVNPASSGDLSATYHAAQYWRQTGDFSGVPKFTGNLYYPPLYYVSLLPFMKFGFKPMAALFYLLQFPLFFLAVRWLVRAVSSRPVPSITEYLIAAALTVNFRPFLETFSHHKVDSVVFALICLALFLFRGRKELWAGVAIAFGTMLKYFPAVLALYFLVRRRGRALLGILISGIMILLFLHLFLKPRELWSSILYPFSVLSAPAKLYTYHPGIATEFQSVGDAILKWFYRPAPGVTFQRQLITGKFPILSHPELAAKLVTLAKSFFILWTLIILLPKRKWHRAQLDAAWPLVSLEISLTLLLFPIATQTPRYHFAIMLLPAFLCVALLLHGNESLFHLKEKVLFALSYCLVAMPVPGGLLNALLPPNPIWGREYALMYEWLSLPVYGFGLLFVCILLCYKRLGQRWLLEHPQQVTRNA